MNNQQISKIATFFRTNFDMHQPYSILIDGNFLKLLLEKQLDNFSPKLESLLNGKIRLFITSCIIRELQLLGREFKLVLDEARRHRRISCGHDLQVSVDQCLFEHATKDQKQIFIVCSQDIQLRRQLRDRQNVPLMYFGPDQRVTMEDIQKQSLQAIKESIKGKMLPKDNEIAPIQEYKKQQDKKEHQDRKKERMKNAAITGVQLKKIAKGPNPLSAKRKAPQQQNVNQNPEKTKRIRKRKNKNKTHNNDQEN